MKILYSVLVVCGLLSVAMKPEIARSATLLSADKATQVVVLRNVTVKNGAVSGEVVNQSSRPLRDVQLLIRYSWRWKNEFKPGSDDPGISVDYTVEKEIPPGGTIPFTYKPASILPSRADGYFETTVSVSAFTEVIR